MIKIENTEVFGWNAALRGMRNPFNSWDNSDSNYCDDFAACRGCKYYEMDVERHICHNDKDYDYIIGEKDLELAKKLVKAGSDHSKFMRMINVFCDITAPRMWFTQFDTYKVGVVKNSCSTMHTIMRKEFEQSDFSWPATYRASDEWTAGELETLNFLRGLYCEFDDRKDVGYVREGVTKKDVWRTLIEILPQSYNQRATVQMNYAVLRNIYAARRNHKLEEWHDFCRWIEELPYSELITEGIK